MTNINIKKTVKYENKVEIKVGLVFCQSFIKSFI